MVFSIQRFIEDYLNKRRFVDNDQYAVALANAFDQHRFESEKDEFLRRMGRIRTSLFKQNRITDRRSFESTLLDQLDSQFKKKLDVPAFSKPLTTEAKRFRSKRRTIGRLLVAFKDAVESKGIDAFWVSRVKGKLQPGPEKIAQALLGVGAKMLVGENGVVRRELMSGIGFVDVEIQLGNVPHLIELKMLSGKLTGDEQLSTYMKQEGRENGWLVLIDVRKPTSKLSLPAKLKVSAGTIHVLVIDINPVPPSKKRN